MLVAHGLFGCKNSYWISSPTPVTMPWQFPRTGIRATSIPCPTPLPFSPTACQDYTRDFRGDVHPLLRVNVICQALCVRLQDRGRGPSVSRSAAPSARSQEPSLVGGQGCKVLAIITMTHDRPDRKGSVLAYGVVLIVILNENSPPHSSITA